ELDVAADGQAAALLGATVRRLHDARAAASDDREAIPRQRGRHAPRGTVVAVAPPDPRRPEDGDRRADFGKRIEALHELAHDPERAPRIRVAKLDLGRGAQQYLVFVEPVRVGLAAHGDRSRTALRLLLPARHMRSLLVRWRVVQIGLVRVDSPRT